VEGINQKEDKLNIYEKIMILDPGLDEKGVEETIQKVKEIITRGGGEILKTEEWGIKKLAYKLNKREKGYYVLLLFKSPPSVIPDLERHARVTEQIVKIMVVKLQKKREIDAVMASLEAERTATMQSGPSTNQEEITSPAERAVEGGTDVQ